MSLPLLGAGHGPPGIATRAAFVSIVTSILGVTPVAGYLPASTDTTTSTDPWSGRTWTADADMSAQITALGNGFTRAFASASSRYLTTVDTNDLSFGNGTVDSPFSLVTLVNVTDTAAGRMLISKRNTAQTEYSLSLLTTDALACSIFDDSAAVAASRISDAAVTQGAFRLLASTYSGLGGATAANGIVLYDNAVIASTPTNNAGYVAMENLGAAGEIGSHLAHTALFLDGSLALALWVSGAMTAQTVANLVGACRAYFGVPV